MKGHRFLDHTADIKIEAWGDTLEEAFEAAGTAFYDVMLDVERVDKRIRKRIRVSGFDMMSLLFNWIDQLILIFELDNLVFRDFKVNIKTNGEEYSLEALGFGEEYDKEKHGYKVHVKAMTYHEMEIVEEGDRVVIRYVVDI